MVKGIEAVFGVGVKECHYSLFIHRVDENKNQGRTMEQAILTAIKDCRTDGIMADFLENEQSRGNSK